MPSPDEVFQQIESDRAVREREIRLIDNAAKRTHSSYERDMLLRTSVLLTYAHLEGFCRFALSIYISAINSMKLSCADASYALAAATLTKAFSALRNPNSKHPMFTRLLPDDAKLHLLAREQEFVEKIDGIWGTTVELPDTVIDLESNLSSLVLKKNLFKLGLNHPAIDAQKPQIDKLLGIRNAIAHGDALRIPRESEVEEYRGSAFKVMQFVQYEIFNALIDESYRRRHGRAKRPGLKGV